MSNTRTKSSAYVNSLVGFTLDTKPFHSKLTEIAIEYRFEETMNVRIEDAVASQMLTKAGWLYGMTSGGDGALTTLPLQRLVQPHLVDAADRNTDMLGVPNVFAKKATIGYGDVRLVSGTRSDRLVRGNDFFHSYGSCQLRVSLPEANDTDQSRRWQLTNAEGVMSAVTTATQQLALDVSNPSSSVNRIRTLLDSIAAQLVLYPNVGAQTELDVLYDILDVPNLPRSYEGLLNALVAGGTPVMPGYAGWVGEDGTPISSRYVDDALSQLTPPAFFNTLSDMRLREGSQVTYPNLISGPGFAVIGAIPLTAEVPEEWTLEVIGLAPLELSVTGSHHGYVGEVLVGGAFNSPFLTFTTVPTAGAPVLGDQAFITPITRLAVVDTSPTQVWNLIKTDPLAHSRPVFASPRVGSIQDASGVIGNITILDPSLPTGTLLLTAISATVFALSSTVEPGYSGTVIVGQDFNDGRVAFRINAGLGQTYLPGDRYLVQIVNHPAEALNLDLYFGYDLDSYDNMVSGYGPGNPFEFRYDTRFVDYDLSAFNLQVAQTAVSGRSFRLVALPDGLPVATIKKDGSGPLAYIDLTDPTSGVAPDPSLTSVPVYSMAGDPDLEPDLTVFYANTFRLEYSDNGFATSTVVANVPVGGSYSNPSLGISLTLAPASKPFISVVTDSGVEGGDVFAWTVNNEPPRVDPAPVAFSSPAGAYLLMHTSGFWQAPDAVWTVSFTSATDYTVTALYTAGPTVGALVPGYPKTGSLATTGVGVFQNETFKDDLVHFTIKSGALPFTSGDVFTFNTYQRKPSIMVHGSVSGWQPEAVVGEWYFNGHIGFKVNAPTTDVETEVADVGLVTVQRVRPDAPAVVYTFTRLASSFIVNRSDVGIIGYAALTGDFSDDYLTVSLSAPASTFRVGIIVDELSFWNAPDTIVVRPQIEALRPGPTDQVVTQKAEKATLGIALNYDQVLTPPDLSTLFPLGINQAFIDLDTGASPPSERYSPETLIDNGWLPLIVDGYDATNSIAFFPDTATSFTVRSAATNQVVGTVRSLGTLNEPIRFEWDPAFFATYLPLNTRASLMTYGTHLDDKVQVRFFERLTFSTSGGVLLEDALFSDAVSISVDEEHTIGTVASYNIDLDAVVADTFTGFLPGYGNLPYDAEDATGLDLASLTAAQGRYDTGNPLVDHFLRAKFLLTLLAPTTAQSAELADLTDLIEPYLQPVGLSGTTLFDFLAALDADAFTPLVVPEMGIPAQGMGIDVNTASTDGASTTFSSSVSVLLGANISASDTDGFDTNGLDVYDDAIVTLISSSMPPVPAAPNLTSYNDLETPLLSSIPVRTFILSFPNTVPVIPGVQVWQQGAPAPIAVAVVERLSSRTFAFSVASSAEAKVVVT